MPIDYHINIQEGVVYTTGSGVVTPDDLRAVRARLAADADFSPNLRQIIDLRTMTGIGFTSQEVRELAADDSFGPDSRRAILAGKDLDFGMARMYAAGTGKIHENFRVFRDEDEARDWIGIAPSTPD